MCGIVAVTRSKESKTILELGLRGLQHRGQDSVGLAGFLDDDCSVLATHKQLGSVAKLVSDNGIDKFNASPLVIGHTRYATRNLADSSRQMHPHWAQSMRGRCAIVTNGDLVNTQELETYLKEREVKLYTNNDGELLAALVNYFSAIDRLAIPAAIEKAISLIQGGAAALMVFEGSSSIWAFKDSNGIRPMYVGTCDIDGDITSIASSETGTFGIVRRFAEGKHGAKNVKVTYRAVLPGEVVELKEGCAPETRIAGNTTDEHKCIFEAVYFSRPDSAEKTTPYHRIRESFGAALWEMDKLTADVIVAVPKGGIPAALGYSKASGIPYNPIILEEPVTGGFRTFITSDEFRASLVAIKYIVLEQDLVGKSVVLIDDSLVRGTTTRFLVRQLKAFGAKEVHLRIASPPYKHSCHYGIQTADPKSLIYFGKKLDSVCEELDADSLRFLDVETLLTLGEGPSEGYCSECFTGITPLTRNGKPVTMMRIES